MKIKKYDILVHTWNDMTYIPKIQRNLISLSVLNSQCYNYKHEDIILEVTWSCMILNKYYIIGCTIWIEGTMVKASKG